MIRSNYQDIRPSGGAFIIALLASLILLIANRWEGLLPFSQFLTRIVWPIQYAVDLPTQIEEIAKPLLHDQDHLAQANKSLQREQIFLQAQVQKLRALEAENQELRELLKSVSSNKESFSEGRLIRTSIDPFMQQILLNKGKVHGIEIGQPVIDSFGLVGLVTGLNQYTSQVLLVTDPGFAVPIQSVRSGERAIATGSGSGGELRLNHVPRTADFIEGDSLVTSGIGGRFPAGYPVGIITSIQHDPSTRFTLVGISPVAKLDQLRHVLFVKAAPTSLTESMSTTVMPAPKVESPVPMTMSTPKVEQSTTVVAPSVSEIKPTATVTEPVSTIKPASKVALKKKPAVATVATSASKAKPAITTVATSESKTGSMPKIKPIITKAKVEKPVKVKPTPQPEPTTIAQAASVPVEQPAMASVEPEVQSQGSESIIAAPILVPLTAAREVTQEAIQEQPLAVQLIEETS